MLGQGWEQQIPRPKRPKIKPAPIPQKIKSPGRETLPAPPTTISQFSSSLRINSRRTPSPHFRGTLPNRIDSLQFPFPGRAPLPIPALCWQVCRKAEKKGLYMSNYAFPRVNSNQSGSLPATNASFTRKALTLSAFAILISAAGSQAFAQTTPDRFVPLRSVPREHPVHSRQ